jgi:gas vesicle protein
LFFNQKNIIHFKIGNMKTSSLFIGLGVGLLVGAAIGLYLASDEEDRAEFLEKINSQADKAKEKVGKVVDEGLQELAKVTEKVTNAAQGMTSKAEPEQA